MIRFGLCCIFHEQPIKFGTTTAAALGRMSRDDARAKLARLCAANAESLLAALQYCQRTGIGCFRVVSQILPLKTHPAFGYRLEELPGGEAIVEQFRACGEFARSAGLRLSFHPDQFVVLNSLRPEVVESSLAEIEYQAEVAEWVGADVVKIHGGGAFGDKSAALAMFARTVDRLSDRARSRLTVENDDRVYTPADLLPLCQQAGLPLVYDVHHHRVLQDGLSVEEATAAAVATWNREPMFHLSSPLEGWDGPMPARHHDLIDPADFPDCWKPLDATVEVEAKAKETAVLKLMNDLKPAPKRKQRIKK
jgi:UV DNA damage endonuclease